MIFMIFLHDIIYDVTVGHLVKVAFARFLHSIKLQFSPFHTLLLGGKSLTADHTHSKNMTLFFAQIVLVLMLGISMRLGPTSL
jgi:hypothetical protein